MSNTFRTYNLVLLVLIFVLILLLSKLDYSMGRKHQIYYFRSMIGGFVFSFIMQMGLNSLTLLNNPAFESVAHWVSVGLCGAAAFGLKCWMNFVATTVQHKWFNSKIWRLLSWIPCLLVVVMMATPFYKQVFYIAEDGSFLYGDGANIVLGLELIYQIGALLITILGHKYSRSRNERQMQKKLYMTLACIWAGLILSLYFPYAPVYEMSLLPGFFLIYSELVSALMFTDALTGLNNRRKIEDFLENALLQASEENPVKLLMLDLDYFKSINDVLGHQEGDIALQTFADALRRTPVQRATLLGRYGGDEFIAIAAGGEETVDTFRTHLRENLDRLQKDRSIPYRIPFSVGYACAMTKGITAAEMYKRADEDLYINKAQNHEALQNFTEELRKVQRDRQS